MLTIWECVDYVSFRFTTGISMMLTTKTWKLCYQNLRYIIPVIIETRDSNSIEWSDTIDLIHQYRGPQTKKLTLNHPEEVHNLIQWLRYSAASLRAWLSSKALKTILIPHAVKGHYVCVYNRGNLKPKLTCTSAPQHYFPLLFRFLTLKCSMTTSHSLHKFLVMNRKLWHRQWRSL